MGKLGARISIVTVLGALGALVTGCPVWSGSGGNGSVYVADGGADAAPITTACAANADCLDGYCDATTHTCVTATSCASGVACPAGYACDSRSVCVPGCASSAQCPSGQYCSSSSACTPGCGADADCARLSSLLGCNTANHQCAPSGGCTSNAQCAATPATPACLSGTCQATANQCQFDYQCAGGTQCVDGQCVSGCSATSATNCATGEVCVNSFCQYPLSGTCNASCSTGTLCVQGVCLAVCNSDLTCGTGLMCAGGVCRVDTRPHPSCTRDGECNAGSVCYNGACRRVCPTPGTGTDGGCMSVDVAFDVCTTAPTGQRLCASSSEATPMCARSADCSAGLACVDARCQ